MGLRRVGAVGLGHMARQDFARGMHRHGTLLRGHFYRALPLDTVTVHPSQGTDTGLCYVGIATTQHHSGI